MSGYLMENYHCPYYRAPHWMDHIRTVCCKSVWKASLKRLQPRSDVAFALARCEQTLKAVTRLPVAFLFVYIFFMYFSLALFLSDSVHYLHEIVQYFLNSRNLSDLS